MIEQSAFFIDGGWRRPTGHEFFEVISPSTEERIGRCPAGSVGDITAAVAAARTAFDKGPWPRMSLDERRAIVRTAGGILERRAEELGDLITNENGSLRRYGRGHCLATFEYFCTVDLPGPIDRVSYTGARARIIREPAGVVAAIVPWNGAGSLGLVKVLPSLLAGCTIILKPAPETPLDTYLLADAFDQAGLPRGVLNVVAADRQVSEELVRHQDVDVVTFTGSSAAGRRVAEICGQQLKLAHTELGGKSAAILLDDVDLGKAIPILLAGGMLFNNGEACSAWTRIVVSRSRHDEIVDAICGHLSDVKVGDPFDPTTDVGPLVAERQRTRVEGYIASALDEGAKIAFGGGRPSIERGWFVEPTLLVNANNQMRSSREEIFGPVASVISYSDLEEAIEIANDSDYGLSGVVLTEDQEEGFKVAEKIRTGTIGVNAMTVDTAIPFGGYKSSGLGRQHGPEGFEAFLEMKSITYQ